MRHRQAVISDDQRYRYTLYREWDDDLWEIFGERRVLNFVMLNPSTADATKEDPTIRKCIGFAKLLGYNAIRVVNLFAWRATDPHDLRDAHKNNYEVIGPSNNSYIQELPPDEDVVAAWGSTFKNETFLVRRVREVRELLNRKLYCLRKTPEGRPWHPLYVPYGPLIEF